MKHIAFRTAVIATLFAPMIAFAAIYGPGIGGNSLWNTHVGGTDGSLNRQVAMRFRADHTGSLTALRTYVIYSLSKPGYSGGNGGTIRFSIQSNNASGNVPSGTMLGYMDHTTPLNNGPFPLLTLNSPVSLTAGLIYHVVATNIDPNPGTNFVSVNALYSGTSNPNQPKCPDLDWATYAYTDSSWTFRPGHTPILELRYADGHRAGIGYMEVEPSQPIYGSRMAREYFTPTSDKIISKVTFRLRRTGSPGPLTVRLEKSNGTIVEQGTVPASAFSTSTYNWVPYTFTVPRTLTSGQRYHLRFSTTGSSSNHYSIYPVQKGSSYGFAPQTYFADGREEFNTGSGWGPFPGGGVHDYQIYFDLY